MEPSLVIVNATDSILLNCFTNMPSLVPTISWQFIDTELPEATVVSDNGMLIIMSARKEDSGTYSCSINQTTGLTTAEATVVVQCMSQCLEIV